MREVQVLCAYSFFHPYFLNHPVSCCARTFRIFKRRLKIFIYRNLQLYKRNCVIQKYIFPEDVLNNLLLITMSEGIIFLWKIQLIIISVKLIASYLKPKRQISAEEFVVYS